ncbi:MULTISPECIES: DMT family transporter [unclassified Salinibacterium]|uniref:DMT family transporter n=1 Tax=unclassified Salinibacterium TaxID=2632331 RepID=UPI0018CD1B09|nr:MULTISPECIES: DMT family transporter [unclassified Salinibacterium]MBH0053100.1 DMT family transporter [Salinibacterium sp. SWN139]MBH0082362.1 DMT family transporter [Salinibacterium sp. SWN167]
MFTVFLGLSSALTFGAADFFGGIAAKRISPILATAIGAVAGLAVLLLIFPFISNVWSTEAVLYGLVAGVNSAIAIGLLYACLAIGPMSILSPVTAVMSAIVPVTVGLLRGESLGSFGLIAIPVALIAVVLVGFVPEKGAVRPSAKALVMAVGAGSAIGLFFVILDAAPDDSGIITVIANRVVNAALMFTLFFVLAALAQRRRAGAPAPARSPLWRRGLYFAMIGGTLDVIANMAIITGVRIGDLSVIAVLTALYPAGTVLLAAIVLRERIAPVQYVGIALGIAASILLVVGG